MTNTTCNGGIGDDRDCNQSHHSSVLMITRKSQRRQRVGFRSKRCIDNHDLSIRGDQPESKTKKNALRGTRRPKLERVGQIDYVTARTRKVKKNSTMLAKRAVDGFG